MLRARGKQKAEPSSSLPSSALLDDDESSSASHNDDQDHSARSLPRDRPLSARLRRRTRQNIFFYRFTTLWRKDDSTTASPFFWIIGCLLFLVSLEIGYIISIGAFADGEVWAFFFGTATSTSTNQKSTYSTIRVPGNVRPIDNYYSRPHIRKPVPLIVGGSDGSGTRAFVQILEHLNVPILVQDRGTMDVHANEMYDGQGWPALVSRVLNATRSASYDLEDIPDPVLQSANTEIGKFIKSVQAAGRAIVGAGSGETWATSVSWAFKAPVSILLLPLFREQLPAIKVLHIVRDGRDVALSDNHSPVQKFYTDFYPDAEARHKALLEYEEFGQGARNHIKAMQLWNDWNKQVYEYGVRYSDGKTLDVLVMRTEDLLHYPLESVALLADFVGSLKTSQQLCCLSRMSATDLGQSGVAHLDELVEAGAPGLLAHRMYDPHDFQQIRKRFIQFAPGKERKDTSVHGRKLLEEHLNNDDKSDLFKSGGKMASASHPGNGVVSPGFNQAARMQQLLREKRAMAAQRPPERAQDEEEVKSRYGKWMNTLRKDPTLSSHLHTEGRESLSLFGYEPPRDFMDIHPHPELLTTCDNSVVCSS